MKIGITPLIAENIAPANAKSLAIFNGDTKVCDIDISKMKPSNLGTKLYSFGLVSDIHLNITDGYTNSNRFNNALTFFENQGASFCCHSGDMTNIGFWYNADDTEMYLQQFGEYKRICELHPNLPVYGVCGNHDGYNKSITENLTELEAYTGHGLTYTITQGNDLFIFIGQNTPTTPMLDTDLTWLETILESNKNKRCFVFVHSFVADADSGNPLGLYGNKTFDWWGIKTDTFKSIMNKYKNAILFHGHSHMHFDTQKEVKNAIYSTALGFRSVHVPSSATARTLVDGALSNLDASLGYLVDVYENHVVLKGYDFLNNEYVLIAQYCIDTTIQDVS